MGTLLSLVIPALIPTLADTIRGVVSRFTGGSGAQPVNVAETIQLIDAETKKMQALAELDKPTGAISPWVADLRASCRYIIAILVVINAVATVYVPNLDPNYVDLSINLAGSVWSFLFGERMYLGISRGRK